MATEINNHIFIRATQCNSGDANTDFVVVFKLYNHVELFLLANFARAERLEEKR